MPRKTEWQEFNISEDTVNATQDRHLLVNEITGHSNKGMTLTRMLLKWDIYPAAYIVDSVDASAYSWGIAMISEEMFAAGVFPDPNSADQPLTGWLARGCAIVQENANTQAIHIDEDVHTQRKLMYGSPYLIINNDVALGTAFNVLSAGIVRMLYKLP